MLSIFDTFVLSKKWNNVLTKLNKTHTTAHYLMSDDCLSHYLSRKLEGAYVRKEEVKKQYL